MDGTYSCAYFIRCAYYVTQTRNQRNVIVLLILVASIVVIVWLTIHGGRGS